MKAIKDSASGRSWATPQELIEHISATYHAYLRLTLPLLDRLADRIAREKLVPITLLDRFQREFTVLVDLLKTHIVEQECLFFPKIQGLRQPVGETAWVCRITDRLESQIEQLTRDNQEVLDLFTRIEACLADSRWVGRGLLVEQMVLNIRELHENFVQHARLEVDVLCPHLRGLLHSQALAV
jgi:iron-sulfur cluster repair protein YtfE (RIC family)